VDLDCLHTALCECVVFYHSRDNLLQIAYLKHVLGYCPLQVEQEQVLCLAFQFTVVRVDKNLNALQVVRSVLAV
jgi:hypothetical protein